MPQLKLYSPFSGTLTSKGTYCNNGQSHLTVGQLQGGLPIDINASANTSASSVQVTQQS